MARPPKNDIEAKRLGKRLTDLWKERGSPSYQAIYDEILRRFGHSMGSAEQVRKFHRGEIDPTTTSVEDLMALCRYYGIPSADLSEVVDLREQRVLALIGESDTGPEQGGRSSRWYVRHLRAVPDRNLGRSDVPTTERVAA
jgi:hypothetical protein